VLREKKETHQDGHRRGGEERDSHFCFSQSRNLNNREEKK